MPTKNGKRANWIKNFGSSVKFSAIDILKDVAPNMYDTKSNAQESVTDIVKEIRDLRSGQSRMMEAINGAPAMKYAMQGAKNAVKDLKSGRLNNQKRIEDMANAEMDEFSMEDGGTDIDFSPSEDYPSGGDNTGIDFSPIAAMQPAINATASATRETAIATNQVGTNINKQTKVIATSFDASIALSKQVATTTFAMNQMMHEQSMSALNAVNGNLANMIDFNNDTVSKLTMGSLKYYDDSLNVMNNILGELQKSNRHIADKPEEEEPEQPQYKQLFTHSGVMKFSKYPAIFKKNFINTVDEDPILSTVKEFLTDEDALKLLAANPLGGMSTFIASSLIPITVKKFIGQLDESIGSFFPALFAKINRGKNGDNPLMSMLAKMFGVNTSVTTTPNFSNYEKGPVPFDGITRTTINSVIPKYLAGILAAVSGKEEMSFDAVRGQFVSAHSMKKEYEDEQTNQLIAPFSKIMREMAKTIEDAITFRSDEERKDMEKDMERMFKGIAKSGQLYEPEKDDLTDLGVESRSNANLLKAAYLSMAKGKQSSAGLAGFKAQANLNEYFDGAIANDPAATMNLLNVFGGMSSDDHIKRNAFDQNKYKVKKGSSMGGQIDEFGKSQIDLLRDIKEIILEGITVYPSSRSTGIAGGPHGPSPKMTNRFEKYKAGKAVRIKDNLDDEEAGKPSYTTKEEKEEAAKNGRMNSSDVDRMDSSQILDHLKLIKDSKNGDVHKKEMGGIYSAVDKYINVSTFGEKIVSIKESIEKFFKSPIKLFTGAIDKIDSALYTIIYGDAKGNSIISVAISSIKNTFNQFTGWLKKKYDASSKMMFGEEGIKGTKMYKWAKEKGNQMMDYIFGKKEGGEDGSRKGGVLSSSFNALGDIFKQTRASMFGTAYKDSDGKAHGFNKRSVFNEVKIGVLRGFQHMRTYLFGDPKLDKTGKKMSFADQMYDTLGEGYNNFKNFFFGTKTTKEDGKTEFKNVMTDFKAKMPKALAYGMIGAGVGMFSNFGVLGALFLPGGPVGGAILGTAVGLLGQSEKFKSFLFGPKGADTKRTGGIVSKKVINWFGANKTAILGGGMFGAMKGLINSTGLLQNMGPLGYMTSMFLPGGIVGGAIMGAAIGIGIKSRTFQNFLYGKDDGNGAKKGGLLNRSFSQSMKKHLPNMAFGALSFGVGGAVLGQMGIMGAMLTPAGPIGAAIMGAATGIAISSQKFRKYLFGEKDEKTGFHKAGLFDKLSNIFKLSIVEPFKLKLEKISWGIEKWFTKSIANPFRDAMAPLKVQFKVLTDNMKTMFVEGWKSMTNYIGGVFTKYVGMPFGKFMEERVMKPMRNFVGKLVNGIGKVFGTILASPIKALSIVAASFQASQERRGVKQGKEERSSNLKMSIANVVHRQKNGEGMGVFANAKRVAMGYISKDVQEKDKNRVAWYRVAERKRIQARDAEQAKYFAEGDSKISDKDKALKDRRTSAKDINFDTSFKDKNGNLQDASSLYNMSNGIDDVSEGIKESNSILTKVKNVVSNIGAHITGNPNFLKKDAGEKPEVKTDKNSKKPGGPAGPSGVEPDGKSGWKDFDFDMQMFGGNNTRSKRKLGRMKKNIPGVSIDQEQKPGGKTFDPTMSKQEREFEKKNKATGGDAGLKYLRIIASNVDGQLNGIGSNVYKMRKAIETLTGTDSGDEGSVNKDRVTLLGKAGRMAKMMLFHPVEFIGGFVAKPFIMVSNFIGKILNAGKAVIEGAYTAVKTIGKGVYSIGKRIGKAIGAIPGLILDVATGIGEIAKDLVLGGLEALTHGVVGLIDTSFTLISAAGEGISDLVSGVGKGLKYVSEGFGLMSKELFKGIGKFTGLAVDFAMETGKVLVDVAGAGAEMLGGIATSVVSTVGTLATTVLGGVSELITTATGALFSIITSPFKWVGGLLNKIMPNMNKVFVTGGTLDVIKRVEVIDKLKSSDGIDSLITTVSGASSAAVAGKGGGRRARLKKKLKGAAGLDLQMFSAGKDEAGQPSASNINSEMLESGLAPQGGGMVKRTASFMNAVKQNLSDKLFSKTNGTKQTSLLGKLLDVTTKHTGAFGKFVKWIMVGFAALLSLIKNFKLPSILGNKTIAGAMKDALEKVMSKAQDFGKDAARGMKGKLSKGFESLKSKVKNSKIYQKTSAFVKENMPRTFGSAAEDGAKSIADGINPSAGADAGAEIAEGVGKEVPGKIASSQSGEVIEDVGKSLEKESPKWLKAFREALGYLEAKLSSASGATLKFADALYATASKSLTGTILAKYAGKLAGASAKVAGGVASLGALDAILAIWNTTTGIADAANIFKVNSEAVTVPMRLCAAATKVVFGNSIPAIVIIDVIFSILGEIMGFDHIQYFATMLYKIIADSDSIAKLEAEQGKFAQQASDAGQSLDDYNKDKNKTTWDKMTTGFQSMKDSVSGALFGKNDANGKYQNGVFANIKDGWNNNLAYLAGQNDKDGNYQKGVFAKAKDGVDNNLAYLFGQNDSEGKFQGGVFANSKKAIKDKWDNTLAWLFGQNDDEGKFKDGYIKSAINNNLVWLFGQNDADGNYQGGVFANAKKTIGDKWDNTLAWLFGQNDDEGKYKDGYIKTSVHNTLAWLFGQNDADGNYQGGLLADAKKVVVSKWDNTMAWLFGQNDEDGKFKRGCIKTAVDNNLAWLFGQNDGNGNYQGGIFSDAEKVVEGKWDNALAWIFGQNDEDGDFQRGCIKKSVDNTLAWLFGQNDGSGNYQGGIFSDSAKVIQSKWDNTLAWIFGQDDENGNSQDGIIKKKMNEGLSWMFGENDSDGNYKPGIFATAGDKLQGVIQSISSTWTGIENDMMGFYNDIRDSAAHKYQVIKDTVSAVLDEIDTHMGTFFGLKDSEGNYQTFSDRVKDNVSSVVDSIAENGGMLGTIAKAGRSLYNYAFKGGGAGDKRISKDQFAGSGEGETAPTEENGFSYYSQDDPRWKNSAYGTGNGMSNFGDSGCGPTAMAMVASDLTGAKITPDTMANYSLAGGYRVPGGTSESFFTDAGKDLGLQSSPVAGKSDMVSQLSQGNPVVLGGQSDDNGPFTRAGHYSVAVGLNNDGTKAIMNDPRGPQYSKAVDINKLTDETVTGYSFSNGFKGNGKRKFKGNGTGSRKRSSFRGAGNLTGDDILAAGEEQLGLVYHLGGDGNDSTDCGKFTLDTFAKCGCDLTTRTADGQYKFFEDHGAIIDPSQAKPGDLIFFSSEDNGYADVGHVGIYAGNNYSLNAATSTGVAYADMSRYWGDRIVGAGSVNKVFGIEPGVGKGPGSIPTGSSHGSKGGTAKPKTLMDLMSHIGSMYSNFSASVIGGKVYTGTAWDSDGNGSSGKSGKSAGSIGGGNVDRKTVYNFLKDQGYNEVAIAGIMGNIEQEHHFNTSDVALDTSSGQEVGGLGLFQWTHDRAEKMRAFAESTNRDPSDAGAQLDFMMKEINDGYHSVAPNVMNSFDSPETAAAHFNSDYEGGTMGDRQEFASQFYNQFADGSFTGGGIGDSTWKAARMANIYRLIHGGQSMPKVNARYARQIPKTNSLTQLGAIPNAPKLNSIPKVVSAPTAPPTGTEGRTPTGTGGQISDNAATIGDVTQSAVDTFTGGEYFNDASKITKEASAFVKGSGTLADVAKSIGLTNPGMDDPLSAKQQWMLGFREYSPIRTWSHYVTASGMWKDSGQTSLESWTQNHDFTGGGIGDIFKQRLSMYGYMGTHRMDSSRLRRPGGAESVEKLMAKADANRMKQQRSAKNGTVPGAVSAPVAAVVAPVGITQADIHTFTGGEYYNDPTKLSLAAKNYATGKGTLSDVAKSIGLSSAPSDDTPLTVDQQQMLGFREYSPVRTWANYKIDSEMWKSNGKTGVEQWMEGKVPLAQPIVAPVSNAAKAVANFTSTSVPSPVSKVDKQVSSVDATALVRNYNASVNGTSNPLSDPNSDIYQKMVELLTTIAGNTGNINDGIGQITKGNIIVDNGKGSQKIIAINAGGASNTATDQLLDPNGGKATSPEYDYNRKIAAGGSFAK